MPETPPLPWTHEYQERREPLLAEAVRDEALREALRTGTPLPAGYGIGLDERCVELPWLAAHVATGPAVMLDAGSVLNQALLLDLPAFRDKHLHIVTLAPEAECFWSRGIGYLYEDLRALPIRDATYDLVTCVSTLEHVGCDNAFYGHPERAGANPDTYPAAVRELARVLRPGGTLLLTVPYGVYEFHGAFQQFDASRLATAIGAFGPAASVTTTYYRYTAAGWQRSDAEACADARYVAWVSTLMRTGVRPDPLLHEADFASAARAVACVRLVKSEV
jgi:SAM-dependent methyltransferase